MPGTRAAPADLLPEASGRWIHHGRTERAGGRRHNTIQLLRRRLLAAGGNLRGTAACRIRVVFIRTRPSVGRRARQGCRLRRSNMHAREQHELI